MPSYLEIVFPQVAGRIVNLSCKLYARDRSSHFGCIGFGSMVSDKYTYDSL